MAVKSPYSLQIGDESGVGEARRAAIRLAGAAGFDETETGKVAIAVTEAATNVLKHGSGGEILLRPTAAGIEMLAIDKGPGIADLKDALRDGQSSAGTAGIGLGAIARLASLFDIYTGAGAGTVLVAEFHPASYRPRIRERATLEIGAAQSPYPGEQTCGDTWAVKDNYVLVADGLGHGFHAATAAEAAVKVFEENSHRTVREAVEAIHRALVSTRGAAVAVTEIDFDRHVARFCGLGNVMGTIIAHGSRRGMMSHNGTAGHEMTRIVQIEYPLPEGALLLIHTDGISAKWDVEAYPGLAMRHPALIAAVLYRDFRRRNDDATMVVARVCPPASRGGAA